MSDDRPLSADRVPTLTEVVDLVLPAAPAPNEDVAADTAVPVAEPGSVDWVGAVGEAAALPPVTAAAEGAADAQTAKEQPAEERAGEEQAVDAEAPAESSLRVDAAPPSPPAPAAPVDRLPALAAAPPVDVDALVGQVLSELTPRIDMLLESRLREALAPALARVADGLIRETRAGLAAAMRDLAREAVDRALQRRDER